MKKLWVSIKRGLIREPKHRIAMGECIWLFEYMIDIADWESGTIPEWKDEAAADDMQMPVRTLREQRRKLETNNYINCIQKQYTQTIEIKNWTNPREYSGEVYNPKQGDKKTSPSKKSQGDTQDYIQGDTQGSTQDVTPTYSSNNQIPNTNTTTDTVEFSEIATYYQNNYTMIVAATRDWLNSLYDTYPPRWIMDALEKGVMANVRKPNYVEAILKDWQANGRDAKKPERKQYTPQNKTASGADALEQYAKKIGVIV